MLGHLGRLHLAVVLAASLGVACGGDDTPDGGAPVDTGVAPRDTGVEAPDSGVHPDAGPEDTGMHPDAGPEDTGVHPDAGPEDSGVHPDAGPEDTGVHPDAGPEDTGMHPDAGPEDAGPEDTGPAPDGGPEDTGPDDAGDPDAGVVADAGMPDTGVMPDAGLPGVCTDGEEGCLCGFGGTCNDPALSCVNVSGNVDPSQRVNICVRGCIIDAQCAASAIGTSICREVGLSGRACVSQEVGEGGQIDVSRLHSGTVSGCSNGLLGLSLPGIADDQASCVKPCSPSAAPGAPEACGPQYPYCNPGVLTSSATPGICTLRRAQHGDVCSQTSGVGICDTATSSTGASASLSCVFIGGFDIRDADDPSPSPVNGICLKTCDLANPDCSGAGDPGIGAAVCRQFDVANTISGFCSNECTQWPSRCQDPGVMGTGTTCIEVNVGASLPEMGFCRGIMPPTIPEWDWTSASGTGCLTVAGGSTRCTAGAYCINDGGALGGVCIRTCDASAPAASSGCAASTVGNSRCNDAILGTPTDGFGACQPPAP